jgi:CheY-like chemotaxis protein
MSAPPATGKTILVADETAYVRERFLGALAQAGHQVVTAGNAPDLLGRLRADPDRIDLIVLDLHLRQGGGVALVRAIRRIDGGRIPVLILSGTLSATTEVRSLAELGVAGYLNEYSAPASIQAAVAPHLYPSGETRRSSVRALLVVSVSYRIGQLVASSVTLNLGRGGLAVRTIDPLAAGTIAHVRFRLPGTGSDVDADARVVWSDRRVGMGLAFERIDPVHQQALDRFVEQHFFSNRRA